MPIDESTIEAIIIESIRNAKEGANRVFARPACNAVTVRTQSGHIAENSTNRWSQAERIGIFVTCLRSELTARAAQVPYILKVEYEQAKNDLCRTDNWKDVGVFGDVPSAWTTTASGRSRRVRLFGDDMDKRRLGELADKVKTEDAGFDFNQSFNVMEGLLRDMRISIKTQESINGQAAMVASSLCEVAESLAQPTV